MYKRQEKAVVNVAGSFKNGGGATAANHAATYSKHGSIQMDIDSTLGITSTSSVVSASQLVAYPNATLSTPDVYKRQGFSRYNKL